MNVASRQNEKNGHEETLGRVQDDKYPVDGLDVRRKEDDKTKQPRQAQQEGEGGDDLQRLARRRAMDRVYSAANTTHNQNVRQKNGSKWSEEEDQETTCL